MVSIPNAFNKTDWKVSQDGALQGGFDPEKLQVLLMPSGTVHYHETIY
jgi:hypothetical protein